MTNNKSNVSHLLSSLEGHLHDGGPNSTVAYLENFLRENPANSVAHFFLGKFYLDTLKEYELAESHLRLALKFSPPCPDAFIELGRLLIQKQLYREAELTIRQGLNYQQINPSAACELLGNIYESLGKYQLAKKYCKAANKQRNYQSVFARFIKVKRGLLKFFFL